MEVGQRSDAFGDEVRESVEAARNLSIVDAEDRPVVSDTEDDRPAATICECGDGLQQPGCVAFR